MKLRVSFFLFLMMTVAVSSIYAGIEEYPEQVKVVSIISSKDQVKQPALFYVPPSEKPRPLLVALHTWSSHYDQGGGEVSYANWCIEHGWIFIHPHFRGPNNNPKALGSEFVVSDIEDAVKYAKGHANVDPERVYLIGASGGGHAALLMAGRKPEIWAAVSAWCPIFDVEKWWQEKALENSQYAKQMEAACGGKPGESAEIDRQYRIRSPKNWLHPESTLPVQIATGVHDGRTGSVPFTHSLRAFNALADPKDKLTEKEITEFYRTQSSSHLGFEPFFDPQYHRKIHFRRNSSMCQVTIFEGTHEIIHGAGLSWLANQIKGEKPVWDLNSSKLNGKYGGSDSGK
ncbi:MAG TPA: prolyl oligopeptidase family serine peptidase [bacterium]|nr:prolyl oligopeptidase family serine peptidase [bacterium]